MSSCNDSINISGVNSRSLECRSGTAELPSPATGGGQISGLDEIGGVVIAGCWSEPKHPEERENAADRLSPPSPGAANTAVLVFAPLAGDAGPPRMTAEASATVTGEI